jgi:hypothetical protein
MDIYNFFGLIALVSFFVIGVSATRYFLKWRVKYALATLISSYVLTIIVALYFFNSEIFRGTGRIVYYVICAISIIVLFSGLLYPHLISNTSKRRNKNI